MKRKLYEEMKQEIDKLEEEITDLTQVNKELSDLLKPWRNVKCQGKK